MQKVTIVADSTLVGQVAEGREIEVVIDEKGTMFIPLMTAKILISGSAVDAPKGKRGGGAAPAETAAEPAAPAKGGRGAAKAAAAAPAANADKEALTDIFQRYDDGDLEGPDAEAELTALTTDKKLQKALIAVLTEFTGNQALKVKDVVDMAVKALNGEEVEVEPDDVDGEIVDVKALEVGDRVTVTFGTNDDYDNGDYPGEVISKGRGGVKIHFDGDDEPIAYDDSFMEQIVKHAPEPAAPAKKKGRGK